MPRADLGVAAGAISGSYRQEIAGDQLQRVRIGTQIGTEQFSTGQHLLVW
jgi:hypothetical protein